MATKEKLHDTYSRLLNDYQIKKKDLESESKFKYFGFKQKVNLKKEKEHLTRLGMVLEVVNDELSKLNKLVIQFSYIGLQ
jgi:hypothetical protein